ncbi:MAG: hypothetical protein HRT87_12205 [Legionellales bacterium]|nr:hypothetical protein [Legionellales bacterium]
MKKITLILLLLITFNTNAQERKNCVTTIVEKVSDYKVKVIRKNTCGETTVIKIQTYLKKDWEALKKKRKIRKRKTK